MAPSCAGLVARCANWPPPAAIWSPSPFPVSRSPSVHRGDPDAVNLHCGGLARLRSRLAGGSAPAAPCDSSGISALWKRAKGAGAPGAPGRKSASSFSASFQLTTPPHGGPQTRADRRTTQDRTEKHNDTSHDPWASTDHDPSSSTEDMTNSGEIHTATQTLAFARTDIHTAVGADDAHRRRQYAQSALSYANTVLWPPTLPTSRRYAGYYQEDALAMIAGA